MRPESTRLTNHVYHLAGEPGEGEMPCTIDTARGHVTSFWRPENNDNVVDGNAIFVHVAGPIKIVRVGLSDRRCFVHQGQELKLEPWTEGDGGMIGAAHFKAEIAAHFFDGGFFYFTQYQIPPYPVAIWIEQAPEGMI